MVKNRYKLIFYLSVLLSIFLLGCSTEDGSIFKKSTSNEPINNQKNKNQKGFNFTIKNSAFPENKKLGIDLNIENIPNNSIYLKLSNNYLDNNLLKLDVYLHNFDTREQQIYDMPLLIRYDKSKLRISDSLTNNLSLIEGDEATRLRSYLNPEFAVLIGKNNLEPLVNFPDCNSYCGYYNIGHSLLSETTKRRYYHGIMFSIIINVLTNTDFESAIGFELSQSMLLDINGDVIQSQFFGGILSRN